MNTLIICYVQYVDGPQIFLLKHQLAITSTYKKHSISMHQHRHKEFMQTRK